MTEPQGWRYKKAGVDQGTIGIDALQEMVRDGELADDDWVFSPALGRWAKVWEVDGLKTQEPPGGASAAQALGRRQGVVRNVIVVDVAVTLLIGAGLAVYFMLK